MVLEEKTLNLLALLSAHVRGDAPVVPIEPRPPTLAPSHVPTADAPEKKRKRGKQTEDSEEWEIPQPIQQPSSKELRDTKAQQKKGTSFGAGKGIESEQRSKATTWNPAFVLSSGYPVTSEASLKDAQKGRSGLVSECLKKALLLPDEMQELNGLRKHEVFLSLKEGPRKG